VSEPFEEQVTAGAITNDGERSTIETFLGLLDTFEFWFNIVTP
jgi:alkyl sulfatase BDS1-like metallo-beta-lactamase superfamily hydrolase